MYKFHTFQELTLEDTGFGESLRGGGAICFGTKAIDDFLTQGSLSYIIRAHEAHSEGVSLSKGAKVLVSAVVRICIYS